MTLIAGDDGLPASEVGEWAKEKHTYLLRYLDISRGARKKFIGPKNAGAAYLDMFCGPGRARIRETGEWIDGSAVAAWKTSVAGGSPFSSIFISDIEEDCVNACAERLRRLNAPVVPICAPAVDAVRQMVESVNNFGLHLAFLDPFNLESLEFSLLQTLASLQRIDLLIHLSAMDLARNLPLNLAKEGSALDAFAPGWRDHVKVVGTPRKVREGIIEYWRNLVAGLNVRASTDQRLITGSTNQPLYWLLLAARSELAHSFWSTAMNPEGQGKLFA